MFIPYLRQICLFFFLAAVPALVSADVYKWVDEQGQTHYSQTPPMEQQAEMIKAPPPPARLPEEAQQEVDQLIEQQTSARKEQQKLADDQKKNADQQQILAENCETAKSNLQQYQDNPGRRSTTEDGTITRLKEEERQQKIKDFQADIKEYCQ